MMKISDQFPVPRPLEEVWDLLETPRVFSRCIPTLKKVDWKNHDEADAVVGVTLGAIPVESRLSLRVVERVKGRRIAAEGISYMGETVEGLRPGRGLGRTDVGRIRVVFELAADGEGRTLLSYQASVEATGRLQRIYESVARLKAPALQAEFRERLEATLLDRMPASAPIPRWRFLLRARFAGRPTVLVQAVNAAGPDAAGLASRFEEAAQAGFLAVLVVEEGGLPAGLERALAAARRAGIRTWVVASPAALQGRARELAPQVRRLLVRPADPEDTRRALLDFAGRAALVPTPGSPARFKCRLRDATLRVEADGRILDCARGNAPLGALRQGSGQAAADGLAAFLETEAWRSARRAARACSLCSDPGTVLVSLAWRGRPGPARELARLVS